MTGGAVLGRGGRRGRARTSTLWSCRPPGRTTEAVRSSDVVITRGCGDACPSFPGERYLDWQPDDPAGQGRDAVRPLRDRIEQPIRGLLAELDIEVTP